MTTMSQIWRQIEDWYSTNAPSTDPGLNNGATSAEIRAAEEKIGVEFPEDLRESYGVHNGSTNAVFPNGYALLSLDEIVDEHSVWCELLSSGELPKSNPESVGPVGTAWWNPKWIPISHSGGGDHDCVDMAPPAQGVQGQMIVFDHERGPRFVSANSFREWLQKFADDLSAERFFFDKSNFVLTQQL